MRRRRRRIRSAAITTAVALVAAGGIVASATAANAAPGCFAGDVTAERWVDGRGVTVFTTDAAEELEARGAGFTPTGDAIAVASQKSPGLVPLYDAYRTTTGNHAFITTTREFEGVIRSGWIDKGIVGYVSAVPLDCDAKMTRAVRGALHTVALGQDEVNATADAGYRIEYSWYAPTADSSLDGTDGEPSPQPSTPTPTPTATTTTPPPAQPGDGNGVFTIATYPDTQQDVFAGTRLADRAKWLVAQRSALDLRFVMHTGDVVNWDTPDHAQMVFAENALDPLEAAGIPYQLSIGNHDTMATGPGGGVRDSKRTREYQRTTTTFNSYFKAADYGAVAGAFEQGKVDNTYSTFTAEGATWLVLNLELWPRVAVVDWAEKVIAANPKANVIIQTHSFLDGNGNIDGAGNASTRWQYGDSSPQYVYDRLVAPYSNVKVVTSGHVGYATAKTVTTAKDNTVAFMLQAIHTMKENPIRLSAFDVRNGTISTKIYSPMNNRTDAETTLSGMRFITG